MKAVILAAGKGTRMGQLTRDMPKPMIPVAGKPVIEHIIRHIMRAGVTEFVVVTRYLGEKIEDYLGDGAEIGARIEYVRQSERYGTGAALLMAREMAGSEPVIMTYGDIITPTHNYSGALATFREKNGSAVMTLNWMDDPWRGGAVHVDESGKVCKIVEKPAKGQVTSHWNSAGIFVFRPVIFEYLAHLTPSPRGEYELPDAMNRMIDDGLAIYPYYLTGAWQDVGTVQDIAVAERILREENAEEGSRPSR